MKAKVRFHLRPVTVDVEYDPVEDQITTRAGLLTKLEIDDSYFKEIDSGWEIDTFRTEVLEAEYDSDLQRRIS